MEAIYSLHVSRQFSCQIPKKNGKGFLKTALGGHFHIPIARVFSDACLQIYGTDPEYCDMVILMSSAKKKKQNAS
jgi:hypothetical protein